MGKAIGFAIVGELLAWAVTLNARDVAPLSPWFILGVYIAGVGFLVAAAFLASGSVGGSSCFFIAVIPLIFGPFASMFWDASAFFIVISHVFVLLGIVRMAFAKPHS